MRLKNRQTGKFQKSKVSSLESRDQKRIKDSKQYTFDWKKEEKQKYDLYKIYLVDQDDEILGLLSLKDIKKELRIHINLIEISAKNIGKNKEYERIAGCLIAFAAQLSFDKSYDGFVSLVPKTKLVDHYCKTYGFEKFGHQLGLGYEASVNLIKNYL